MYESNQRERQSHPAGEDEECPADQQWNRVFETTYFFFNLTLKEAESCVKKLLQVRFCLVDNLPN